MPVAAESLPESLRHRVLRALLRRQAPWWAAALLPWLLLCSASGLGLLSVAGLGLWSASGLLLCVAVLALAFRRLRRSVRQQSLRWLDAAVPALEDSSALLETAATPVARLQQQRLLARLDSTVTPVVLAQVARAHGGRAWPLTAASVAAALAVWAVPHALAPPAPGATPAAAPSPAALAAGLRLQVTPPAYTGAAASDGPPRELQVPENSGVRWCRTDAAPPGDDAVELSDGTRLPLASGCASWVASESVFWRWQGARYTLRVLPDQPPAITVLAPTEPLQVLGPADAAVRIAVQVRDDHRIVRASLHLTLARGSGENIRFSDREMPLPQSADPRARDWAKSWTLAELGMEPGDELYFFVRASDNAEPRAHTSSSPVYTLRLPGPQASRDEASALPMLVKPENLRSQRQVIIDTEQLLADLKANPRMKPADLRSRSEDIASDQAQLRRRYGHFLGEESSLFGGEHEEEHEAEAEAQSAEATMTARFGHVHDQAGAATLFDEPTKKVLRRALSAMWDAEKALRAITPQAALPHEYRALEAVKLLQQADRIYLHRTAFVPPPIKEDKRLSGDMVGTRSYLRLQASAEEPVPAPVRELAAALAAGQPLPALWPATARAWLRERLTQDDERLGAQRAVQDVQDGCEPCRPALAAWLRSGAGDAPVRLQAQPVTSTAFALAWQNARRGAAQGDVAGLGTGARSAAGQGAVGQLPTPGPAARAVRP